MFCPTCGKENSSEIKFCASCGTNLEAISHALTGAEEDFFTRFDNGIDQFIGRYTEHVFRNNRAGENTVGESWQLLGQGVLTSLIDLLLFTLMWSFLPIRFLLLLISTPFRLLSAPTAHQSSAETIGESYQSPELRESEPGQLPPRLVPSVTENTTSNLRVTRESGKERVPTTDRLK